MHFLDTIDRHHVAGLLLIAAFFSFAIGAVLPVVGPKGNIQIFTLPLREHLLAVGDNEAAWRRANVLMGSAIVVLAAGLTLLTSILEAAGERIYSRVGLAAVLAQCPPITRHCRRGRGTCSGSTS